MAYLPDLSSPSSWELGERPRRPRGTSVAIALFFALLLCAASSLATAVYLDGVRVDARLALDDEAGTAGAGSGGSGGDGGAAAGGETMSRQEALDAAWVAGRKAGYKRGVAAGKAQAEKARKKAVDKAFAQGKAAGLEAGRKEGYSEGYRDAAAKYDAAWKAANPQPAPGETAPAGGASTPQP